jgi:heavy metal sensor kinase
VTSWWSRAPIRARLTGWYSFVLFLMLVGYASATFLAVRHEFYEQFDDQLYEDLESMTPLLTPSADGPLVWSGERGHDADDDRDRGQDIWLSGGASLFRSSAVAALPPVIVPNASATPRYDTVVADGRPWRTVTRASNLGGQAVVLRAARSESHLRMQLWEILVVLMLGLPVVVAFAGLGGYALARRALAPMDRLASAARRITADRLHERIAVPNQHDEIGRLAAVFNDTLGRLEQSFEQLRRFTADASHELRTPLAVMRGLGESGLSDVRPPAEYQDMLSSMLEEVDRLTSLVDTLLRLSRADAGTVRLRTEPVDLAQLARDVGTSLGVLAEEQRQPLVVDAPGPVVVAADPLVLREALMNVVDNAITYGPEGSTVTIRVSVGSTEATVTIADEGPGIPVEYRARIFDRFFRIDEARSRQRGGSGLGLSIAKWAVDAHGGRISVDDGVARGAVFRIDLPFEAARTHSDSDVLKKERQI